MLTTAEVHARTRMEFQSAVMTAQRLGSHVWRVEFALRGGERFLLDLAEESDLGAMVTAFFAKAEPLVSGDRQTDLFSDGDAPAADR